MLSWELRGILRPPHASIHSVVAVLIEPVQVVLRCLIEEIPWPLKQRVNTSIDKRFSSLFVFAIREIESFVSP